MSSGGGKVWIAGTTENAKVLIGGCGAIESHVGAEGVQSLGGESVEQICGSVERLDPKTSRQ
jgi:ABC-type hemin transport system substrate-binding protein